MTLSIGGIAIGSGNPCRFVAELSNNHNGSLDRALRLVSAAKDAGADFIKLQAYTADELVALRGDGPAPAQWGEQGWTMRALYEKARTPFEWFPVISEYCRDMEIPWLASVFGNESLAMLKSIGCPAYKIARLDNQSEWLRDAVEAMQRNGTPIIVSESRLGESGYHTARGSAAVAHLYCPTGYPQKNLALGQWQLFDGMGCSYCAGDAFDGFSYHGTDPRVPVAAATLGAKIVECHFQLDDEPSELEQNISLTASQFRRMVDDVRAVEAMLA